MSNLPINNPALNVPAGITTGLPDNYFSLNEEANIYVGKGTADCPWLYQANKKSFADFTTWCMDTDNHSMQDGDWILVMLGTQSSWWRYIRTSPSACRAQYAPRSFGDGDSGDTLFSYDATGGAEPLGAWAVGGAGSAGNIGAEYSLENDPAISGDFTNLSYAVAAPTSNDWPAAFYMIQNLQIATDTATAQTNSHSVELITNAPETGNVSVWLQRNTTGANINIRGKLLGLQLQQTSGGPWDTNTYFDHAESGSPEDNISYELYVDFRQGFVHVYMHDTEGQGWGELFSNMPAAVYRLDSLPAASSTGSIFRIGVTENAGVTNTISFAKVWGGFITADS